MVCKQYTTRAYKMNDIDDTAVVRKLKYNIPMCIVYVIREYETFAHIALMKYIIYINYFL